MILQSLPDGQLVHCRQTDQLQVGGGADSAQEQDLRALVGAGAEDHLALGADLR